ncbi:hypothetical protein [Actinomycetospora cinnamomea]|uniref:Pyridoxamine 5'-phosphate oxidase-like protein n=1 Tax=Actinomycetospora cinnamomea TaxID=663609 RepID=A0A2U1FB08_9PSEU|nr:hypothetical protein [Actinomycetospora cinnamomea]PVZ09362.1 hypothetical protein C8D89_10617 [Actinomycetospora cinnamomea]
MLSPTTWTEIAPDDCEDLLRSCAHGRFLYTDRALPAIQPTRFQLEGSRLLFLAPPRLKIAQGHVFSFHVEADDAVWTVTAHGPVALQRPGPPQPRGRAGCRDTESFAVDPNEPLVLEIKLIVGHRIQRQAGSA